MYKDVLGTVKNFYRTIIRYIWNWIRTDDPCMWTAPGSATSLPPIKLYIHVVCCKPLLTKFQYNKSDEAWALMRN
jgi:hypothetical protein